MATATQHSINISEQYARLKKAVTFADVAEASGFNSEAAEQCGAAERSLFAQLVQQHPPSEETWRVVIDLLRSREAIRERLAVGRCSNNVRPMPARALALRRDVGRFLEARKWKAEEAHWISDFAGYWRVDVEGAIWRLAREMDHQYLVLDAQGNTMDELSDALIERDLIDPEQSGVDILELAKERAELS